MMKLLKIEWLKISKYPTFYIFIALFILPLMAIYNGFEKMNKSGMFDLSVAYKFPNVWYFESYAASFILPVLSLLIITLTANEFTFRTLRQNIIEGLSREEVLISKLLLSAALSLAAGLVLFLTGLGVSILKSGVPEIGDIFSKSEYLLRSVWQCFGFMTAAILITLIIRRSALSILAFIAILWIIEPIAGYALVPDIYPYFPLNSIDKFIQSPFQIVPLPTFGIHKTPLGVTIAGIIYPLLFIAGSFYLIRRKDL